MMSDKEINEALSKIDFEGSLRHHINAAFDKWEAERDICLRAGDLELLENLLVAELLIKSMEKGKKKS